MDAARIAQIVLSGRLDVCPLLAAEHAGAPEGATWRVGVTAAFALSALVGGAEPPALGRAPSSDSWPCLPLSMVVVDDASGGRHWPRRGPCRLLVAASFLVSYRRRFVRVAAVSTTVPCDRRPWLEHARLRRAAPCPSPPPPSCRSVTQCSIGSGPVNHIEGRRRWTSV